MTKGKSSFQFILLTFILLVGINSTIAQGVDLIENVLDENTLIDNSIDSLVIENEIGERVMSKNSIYGSFGFLLLAASLTGYYERILIPNGANRNYSNFARIGYGVLGTIGGGGAYILPQYGWLTGSGKNHLEIGFGLMIFNGGSVAPSGNIGWRWQLPEPSFILRMGIGVPELIYLGVGISFG